MGFKTGIFPPVDPESFLKQPIQERMKTLSAFWVDNGFGVARQTPVMYIARLLVFYVLLGVIIVTATSGVGWFWEVHLWWNEPIVYQKLVVWTVFLEAVNLAGSWGPLVGKFKPRMGGALFWLRPGTIRMPPWKWVPGTAGSYRSVFDVVIYVLFLIALLVALILPGVPSASLSEVVPTNTSGLVNTLPLIVAMALWVIIGLRDKVVFLASRAEQFLPAFLFFTVLPFTDMIIALKLLIVIVWVGAAISKIGPHFSYVIPAMVSNTPFWPPRWFKRLMYRKYPEDLLPSKFASYFAHGPGTLIELVVPLVLLFSTNSIVTLIAVIIMVLFCIFIISTFPIAVPLEWNTLFAFTAIMLFIGFPAQDGFAVTDFSNGWVLAAILVGLFFFPVLGNLRPDLVSFLPALRQYAGNWATGLWAFAPGAESKLDAIIRPTKNQVDQLQAMGSTAEQAEVTLQQALAYFSMHTGAKATFSLLRQRLPDVESRVIRGGEMSTNAVLGFNFGDGHMQGVPLVKAIQERCNFAPGEFLMAYTESSPIHKPVMDYMLIDAALGVIEKGTIDVKAVANEQPWLPNAATTPFNVTWRAEEWPSFSSAAPAGPAAPPSGAGSTS